MPAPTFRAARRGNGWGAAVQLSPEQRAAARKIARIVGRAGEFSDQNVRTCVDKLVTLAREKGYVNGIIDKGFSINLSDVLRLASCQDESSAITILNTFKNAQEVTYYDHVSSQQASAKRRAAGLMKPGLVAKTSEGTEGSGLGGPGVEPSAGKDQKSTGPAASL